MVLPVVNVAEKNASATRFALVHAFGHRALKVRKTCRSEHARDEPESAEGCQVPSVIVDDHREHARSYNGPAWLNRHP